MRTIQDIRARLVEDLAAVDRMIAAYGVGGEGGGSAGAYPGPCLERPKPVVKREPPVWARPARTGKASQGPVPRLVMEFVEGHEAFTTAEMWEAVRGKLVKPDLKWDPVKMRQAVLRMEKRGELKRTARGAYTVVGAPVAEKLAASKVPPTGKMTEKERAYQEFRASVKGKEPEE